MIGRGTGEWQVPRGGMGALIGELIRVAQSMGKVTFATNATAHQTLLLSVIAETAGEQLASKLKEILLLCRKTLSDSEAEVCYYTIITLTPSDGN